MTGVEIVVRDISGQTEMRAVEELQKEVWGLPDLDIVPLTQLVAAQASGGVVIGAFDRDILAGFAYGFVGYEEGRVTHHSHMLAVRPTYRSSNIGYLLKLAQREKVLEQGIERMTWTFDPLQSVNAYFNFNKLGVVSDQYLVNFYGEDAASFLHRNGTDRLWVTWDLRSPRVEHRLAQTMPSIEMQDVEPLLEVGANDLPRWKSLDEESLGTKTVIEIPADINELEWSNRKIAGEWRNVTRWAFTATISAGFVVSGFERGVRGDQKVGRYFLERV